MENTMVAHEYQIHATFLSLVKVFKVKLFNIYTSESDRLRILLNVNQLKYNDLSFVVGFKFGQII